ncbi:MAG TPA: HAMP domain-containing sensor histidine kinase [Pseudobdellovibrionaceae bacterium]
MTALSPQDRIRQFEKRQITFSGLALLILLGISLIATSLHMQSLAEQNTKFISRMIKTNDFREVGLTLHEARYDNFISIRYISKLPEHSFVLPPKLDIEKQSSFWKNFFKEKVTISTDNALSSEEPDKITFEYNRFRLVPYFLVIWFILNLVSIPQTKFMKKRLLEQFEKDLVVERDIAKAEIARQVRHNLRTPLAALMRIPARLPDTVKADRELLVSTITQIKTLISTLDDRESAELSKNSSHDLYESLVQASREITASMPQNIRFNFDIEDSIISAMVPHIPHELRALMGNLLGNAVEALVSNGQINVTATDLGGEVQITIEDNGKGIPENILSMIFNKGFTFGKQNGTGFGLFHAKNWIESWGGHISVESVHGIKTTFTILLPIQDRAKWYVPRLKFNPDSQLVILDDQETAILLWKRKIQEANLSHQTKFLAAAHEVSEIESFVQQSPERFSFLFDYDLSGPVTGLDLLKSLPASSAKYLVTGNFDQAEVRAQCENEGIFLIPKSQISDLTILVR